MKRIDFLQIMTLQNEALHTLVEAQQDMIEAQRKTNEALKEIAGALASTALASATPEDEHRSAPECALAG